MLLIPLQRAQEAEESMVHFGGLRPDSEMRATRYLDQVRIGQLCGEAVLRGACWSSQLTASRKHSCRRPGGISR
jgi:hypothetical protein